MSDTPCANHFPLDSSLSFYRSVYRHAQPHRYAAFLRSPSQCFDAMVEGENTVVLHEAGREPEDQWRFLERTPLSPESDSIQFRRAVNAHVGFVLQSAGYVRICAGARLEYISDDKHVLRLIAHERGAASPAVAVRAHLRWLWDIERRNLHTWLVPLPGRRFLTATSPTESPRLHEWMLGELRLGERLHAVDLRSGRHRRLDARQGSWGYFSRGMWKPLTDNEEWRITLDMKSLRRLGYSENACSSAQFKFDDVLDAIRSSSPFGQLLEALDPWAVPASEHFSVSGDHLRFRLRCGRELEDVIKLRIFEPPAKTVRLTVVARDRLSDEREEELHEWLNAHLAQRHILRGKRQRILASVGAADGADTIATIWTESEKYKGRGFGLPPFELAGGTIHRYDDKSGGLVSGDLLRHMAEQATQDDKEFIAIVLLEDDIPKDVHDTLMSQFRGMKALPLKRSSLSRRKGYACWVNLTLTLAQKAGAVPWILHELPGTDNKTVFVGLDLGHDHRGNRSRLAFTLINHEGRPLASRKVDFRENNERIPSIALCRDLPRFIFDHDSSPTQVIIHRDGRFLDGEPDDILEGLRGVDRITLVSIKKDPTTRILADNIEGACIRLDEQRAILVTNSQAKNSGMPNPVELELAEPGDRRLGEVAIQAFWLTRVCQGNAYFPKRLPVTTQWANSIAATGKTVHLKGWEHYSVD